MTVKYNGGPVHPYTSVPSSQGEALGERPTHYIGLTIRDHFAGLAMQAFMDKWNGDKKGHNVAEVFSKVAYQMADAMLAERNKP